jgi:signal transduction histidine kinase
MHCLHHDEMNESQSEKKLFLFFIQYLVHSSQLTNYLFRENTMTTQMLVHDLKSPIAALDTLIFALADRLHDDEMNLANLAISRIKDKFKLLKQKNNEKKEYSNLIDLIKNIISEKKVFYIGKNIEINFKQSETLFTKVLIEPIKFKRVISDLIENAKEAMPEGGHIVIHLSIVDKTVQIKVRDNGIGMSPQILKLVQQKGGSYLKENGSGKGLQHAKDCLKNWGGSLEIDSILGIGSIITLNIPLSPRPSLCQV